MSGYKKTTRLSGLKGGRFALILAILFSSATVVLAGPFHHGHGMGNPLEKMIDIVDLSEGQQIEIDKIIASSASKDVRHKKLSMMRKMLELNPDDPDYLTTVEEHAEKAALEVSNQIRRMAKARKDIYDVLTEDQKQEINKVLSKKLSRMSEHMARR